MEPFDDELHGLIEVAPGATHSIVGRAERGDEGTPAGLAEEAQAAALTSLEARVTDHPRAASGLVGRAVGMRAAGTQRRMLLHPESIAERRGPGAAPRAPRAKVPSDRAQGLPSARLASTAPTLSAPFAWRSEKRLGLSRDRGARDRGRIHSAPCPGHPLSKRGRCPQTRRGLAGREAVRRDESACRACTRDEPCGRGMVRAARDSRRRNIPLIGDVDAGSRRGASSGTDERETWVFGRAVSFGTTTRPWCPVAR